MQELSGGIFDADTHYYETRDAFTRHLDPKLAGRGVHARPDASGRDRVWVGDEPCRWLDGVWDYDRMAGPGTLAEQLRLGASDRYQATVEQPVRPAYRDREARLALLDEQGVEAAFLFPSLAVCVEPFMQDDPEQTYGNLHAFNRWIDEEWGFAHRDRLFPAAMLSLLDVELAAKELDEVLARGARVVSLRPGPIAGRSPADPHFDPVWARIEEAGAVVAFHSGNAGYTRFLSPLWGEEPNPAAHRMSAFQWVTCFADRPIMDTLAALVLHNLFGRFPGIRVLSVENGSLWVPYLIDTVSKMVGMGYNGPWIGGRLEARPRELLRRHLWVSPFPEDDLAPLAQAIGVDRIAFGSDYPHPEGLAEPADYSARLDGFSTADVRRIMHDNTSELLGGA